MSEVPEESCDIVPSKVCKSVAQLVPHLSPVEKCSDLPREICSFGLKSPKITEKPLITKWCFDPADEDQLEANNDLPRPPQFEVGDEARELPDPPELIPIEVEDVLIFEDGDDEGVDSGLRNGKKLGISNEAPSVKNQFDPSSSLKTKLPFPERIEGKTRSITRDFRGKDAQKIVETDQSSPDNLEETRQENDGSVAINDEIESINKDEAEGHGVNKQFKAILSRLNSDFRSKIKIEKADIDNDRKKAAALAKIIKHKNSSVSHTILIKNTPEAHKIFGIKNAPAFKEEELHTTEEELHEPNTNEILEPRVENTPDLAFSDETEVEPAAVTSESITNEPILRLGELNPSIQAESNTPPVTSTAANFPPEDITGTNLLTIECLQLVIFHWEP